VLMPWPGPMAMTLPAKGEDDDYWHLRAMAEDAGCELIIRERKARHKRNRSGELRGYRCTVLGPPGEAKIVALAVITAAERAGSDCSSARRHLRTGVDDEEGFASAHKALAICDQSDAESEDSDATVDLDQDAMWTASQRQLTGFGEGGGGGGGLMEDEKEDATITGASEERDVEDAEAEKEEVAEVEESEEGEVEEQEAEKEEEDKEAPEDSLMRLLDVSEQSARCLSNIGTDGAQLADALTVAQEQIMRRGGAIQTASLPTRLAFCVTALNRDFQVKIALPAQCLFLLPYRGVGALVQWPRRAAQNLGQADALLAH
jgi:hypothetical protein